jgi:hypothetical protein
MLSMCEESLFACNRNDDGLKLLAEDVAEIFSPRTPGQGTERRSASAPSSPRVSPRQNSPRLASALRDTQSTPNPAQNKRSWWLGGNDNEQGWWSPSAAAAQDTQSAAAASPSQRNPSAPDEDATEEEQDQGGFWKFFFAHAKGGTPGPESPVQSPRHAQTSSAAPKAGEDWEIVIRSKALDV